MATDRSLFDADRPASRMARMGRTPHFDLRRGEDGYRRKGDHARSDDDDGFSTAELTYSAGIKCQILSTKLMLPN